MIKKLLYIPIVWALGAKSWLGMLANPGNDYERNATKYLWGWLDPAMDPHWDRLFKNPDNEPWAHRAKNIGSEWNRLDAQRGYKAGAFLLAIALSAAALVATGFVILA